MDLKIYKMNEMVPTVSYATGEAACFDLAACLADRPSIKGFYPNNESVVFVCLKEQDGTSYIKIPPRCRVLIPTGMIFNIEKEHHVKIYSRSGLSIKKGFAMTNGLGIVDSDYVEEVFVPMINHSIEELVIKHGDRVAQAEVVFNWRQASLSYIQEPPTRKSNRNGGFGSTGVS
jgi:dUTP pyrophosphatase